MAEHPQKIRRALISVSDKTDIVAFARRLVEMDIMLISTGGTARTLEQADLPVTHIEQITGAPEMLDGRVKTLHPAVHGALLGLRDKPEHQQAMAEHGIVPIDLLCVNLYPFESTIAQPDVTEAEAIEQIDIGGPSMIRSASKNFQSVTVVTDPSQYDRVISELADHEGQTTLQLRREFAQAAFARTAAYDGAIFDWISGKSDEMLPPSMLMRVHRQAALRYGENPHQPGAVYTDPKTREPSIVRARQLSGKQLSFNNLFDANGALELVKEIDPEMRAAVAVIKHANPCGFAVATTVTEAFDKAYAGDPLAAFGGIVAFNKTVDTQTAEHMAEGKKFLEVVVAPDYEPDARKILEDRWPNIRMLELGPLGSPDDRDPEEFDIKRIVGGMLVQQRDLIPINPESWKHIAGPEPDGSLIGQMMLGMIAVKHLKSNAVCLVRDDMLVGAGAGQMDRLSSCAIAIDKAGDRVEGAIAASDAFFPFDDGPKKLIAAGAKAIVQPGGSKRDDDSIAACNEAGVTMMFTGSRHFRH